MTKKALARKASTNIATIQEKLRQRAAQNLARLEPGGGAKVRVTSRGFDFPDVGLVGTEFEVVILDFCARNVFYTTEWDENNPQPPVCAAQGFVKPSSLVPLDEAPKKQSESCISCPNNQWGSHPRGRAGKACQNRRLVAVMLPDATEDDPIYVLDVSPTGTKKFDNYVAQVNVNTGSDPVGFVTTISLLPAGSAVTVGFSGMRPNENALVHFNKLDEARRLLSQPPVFEFAEAEPVPEPKAAPKKKRVAKKRVAKKRTARR